MLKSLSLSDLENLKETQSLECKLASGRDGQGKLPEDFWPTYSAMANTDGGLVILGVKEKRGSFSLQGISQPEKVLKELFDSLNNPNKVSCNLIQAEHIEQQTIDEKHLLFIHIPAATRKQKPVYLNRNPLGNTYRRLYDGDRLLDDDSVRRMLAEQIEDSRDQRILKGFGLDDIDHESLTIYRRLLSIEKPHHPFLENDDQTFLQQLSCYRKDRETGEAGLTLAGLLMFGVWPSIHEALPQFFLDYQEHGTDPDQRWIDRIVPDGSWSGNLFDFYRKVYRKLTADLKIPFAIQKGQRQDDTLVHQALREALVNTLVHADFSAHSSIRIHKSPGGFRFINPGLMRIPPDIAYQGGESDCRNKTLHQLFFMIGLGERAGSGLPKIVKGWSSQDWYQPVLNENLELEQTGLRLLLYSLIPDSVLQELQQTFGEHFQNLSKQERTVMVMAKVEQGVTPQRLQTILKMHPTDASQCLRQLTEKNLLQKHGHTRGTVYTLTGSNILTPGDVFAEEALPSRSSEPLGASSEPLGASSEPLNLNLAQEGQMIEGLNVPLISDLKLLSPEARHAFESMAAPVKQTNKTSRDKLEAILIQLCMQHYFSLKVLSELLDRSEHYLRLKYLNPMVKKQQLERAFPAHPNHPRQAYRSKVG